jgi:ribonuclease D
MDLLKIPYPILNKILERENRIKLYNDCLNFIKTRVELDLALFKDDIWSH